MQSLRPNRGYSSSFAILLVLLLVLGAMLWGLWPRGKSFEQVIGFPLPWEQRRLPATAPNGGFVSVPERLQIEEWITRNRLNEYGDPADTLYEGGSPLMDETTGKLMTRYEYVLKQHPDRPWKK